jgi:hypothetical protein
MICPICNSEMVYKVETMHHGANAFVKCEREKCKLSDHWHRVRDLKDAKETN